MIRRTVLAHGIQSIGFGIMGATGLALMPFGNPAHAVEVKEQVLGDENAPVTIIEYASLTCPHCAAFHNEKLPAIKEEYIDTGKAKLVMRDFPLDQLALIASVLAHCSGPERYFKFLEYFFANQDSWTRSDDPVAALRKQSKLGGLSDAEMDACLNDESMAEGVLQLSYKGQQEHEVRATPTFVINGEIVNGSLSLEEFRDTIDAHLN